MENEHENDDLIVPANFGNYSQSSDDIQINQGDIFNYRGYFVDRNQHGDNDDDDDTQKFYEFGAHFPYYFLVQKLEILKMENDKQNKKEQTQHTPTSQNKGENELEGLLNLPIKHNARSRNRNCNFGIQSDNPHIIDKFSAIPHDKINNDEKTKQPNHNAISMILKDSTSNAIHNKDNNINDINIHNLNNKTEISNTHKSNNNKSVKAYTSFANKLKEAKRINGRNHNNVTNLPHSKNRTQITNNANNNNKNKTLHITNDKIRNNINNHNNAVSQSTTTSKQKNKLEKKIKQSTKHHPDLSTLKYNNNNTQTNKKSRSKSKELSASSHNNQPSSKIAASINNLLTSYKYKRNIHFSPGLHPQPTKITQKRNNLSNNTNTNININQVKILTKNKLNDFISSLSKSSYHKSRNIHTHNAAISSCAQNYNKVNLTNNTKSNAQTDRDKPQQHMIVHKEKSRSESSKVRGVRNMKVNKDKMNKQDSSKKFKTYLDMRYSVFNKTNQQIINEIKKKIANTKHTGHQHSNSKSNNLNTIKTKSKSRSKSKSQSKSSSR